MQYRSRERSLAEANTTSSTAFYTSWLLSDGQSTLLSATCDAVEREAAQLPTPAASTEEPQRVANL